jgi:hypothetical protein
LVFALEIVFKEGVLQDLPFEGWVDPHMMAWTVLLKETV